ncbi:helix-hairpin-helix domain-containing protein [Actinobacillus genomosp. 2]|uniref:ComEA family DNA-binding protein n=1 Tax=Actinobacillus genomosp. 2 TaxID=230709 RepID=UPI002441705C|nr:ComEA family DNA-binding protein [Actinobacillus genomosp. 2]WGE32912.1 helix-hairpin-helix domain-containing protein [Actinobacillus genomosp. 2]
MRTIVKMSFSFLLGLFTTNTVIAETDSTAMEATPVIQNLTTEHTNTAVNQYQVNINTASSAEIQDKLIGIGEKKALAIVEYRTKNGPFVNIEQLTEVSGIGKATLDKNRERITLE